MSSGKFFFGGESIFVVIIIKEREEYLWCKTEKWYKLKKLWEENKNIKNGTNEISRASLGKKNVKFSFRVTNYIVLLREGAHIHTIIYVYFSTEMKEKY